MKCIKKRFHTKLDALLALLKSAKSKSVNREEIRFYKCKVCKGFHLTSQPLKEE